MYHFVLLIGRDRAGQTQYRACLPGQFLYESVVLQPRKFLSAIVEVKVRLAGLEPAAQGLGTPSSIL